MARPLPVTPEVFKDLPGTHVVLDRDWKTLDPEYVFDHEDVRRLDLPNGESYGITYGTIGNIRYQIAIPFGASYPSKVLYFEVERSTDDAQTGRGTVIDIPQWNGLKENLAHEKNGGYKLESIRKSPLDGKFYMVITRNSDGKVFNRVDAWKASTDGHAIQYFAPREDDRTSDDRGQGDVLPTEKWTALALHLHQQGYRLKGIQLENPGTPGHYLMTIIGDNGKEYTNIKAWDVTPNDGKYSVGYNLPRS